MISLARLAGWLCYHTQDSRASAAGYPDLTMVRERVIFAELKAERTPVTPAQREWQERLADAGASVFLWRPSDWPEIESVLLARRPSG